MLHPIQDVVAMLRKRGFALCKPDPKEKKPTYPKWSTRSKEPMHFRTGDQIGIMAGPLSDGGKPGHALIIIDLDSQDAVRLADHHLPVTAMQEGRKSKPRSHRYYLIPLDSIPKWACSTAEQASKAAKAKTGYPGPFKKQFRSRDTKSCVIDFIGTGGQAVCPPALHPSGELREWEGKTPGEPSVIPFPELWRSVCELASACGCEIPDVIPRSPTPRSVPFDSESTPIFTRASNYLAKMEAAVSGCGGHSATFKAARALVWGFDLPLDDARRLLVEEYNPRCRPPWSEPELDHKLQDADRIPGREPRGHLRDDRPGEDVRVSLFKKKKKTPIQTNPDNSPEDRWDRTKSKRWRCTRNTSFGMLGVGEKNNDQAGVLSPPCKRFSCTACHHNHQIDFKAELCPFVFNAKDFVFIFESSEAEWKSFWRDYRRDSRKTGSKPPKQINVKRRPGGNVFAVVVGGSSRDYRFGTPLSSAKAAVMLADEIDKIERQPESDHHKRFRPVSCSPGVRSPKEKAGGEGFAYKRYGRAIPTNEACGVILKRNGAKKVRYTPEDSKEGDQWAALGKEMTPIGAENSIAEITGARLPPCLCGFARTFEDMDDSWEWLLTGDLPLEKSSDPGPSTDEPPDHGDRSPPKRDTLFGDPSRELPD